MRRPPSQFGASADGDLNASPGMRRPPSQGGLSAVGETPGQAEGMGKLPPVGFELEYDRPWRTSASSFKPRPMDMRPLLIQPPFRVSPSFNMSCNGRHSGPTEQLLDTMRPWNRPQTMQGMGRSGSVSARAVTAIN